DYAVIVANSAGSATSIVATLTVLVPPTITNSPHSQAVVQGQNAAFSVGANGTAPFSYQWNFNGTNISGATNALLTLTNIQTTDAGDYAVVVANSAGSATSTMATLTVLVPPTVTTQPQSQAVVKNQDAAFSVVADGTAPMAYQWNLNGTNIAGATNSILLLAGVQWSNHGNYSVVLTNIAGAVTSAVAKLTVYIPPSITTQPQSQTLSIGQSAAFTVV